MPSETFIEQMSEQEPIMEAGTASLQGMSAYVFEGLILSFMPYQCNVDNA